MYKLLKLFLIVLFLSSVSCKSPYVSLYSNEEEVSFTDENISENEKIEFTYIPSIVYSSPGGSNSRNGSEAFRGYYKDNIDSIINLRSNKINISDKVILRKNSDAENSIEKNLIQIIKLIDLENSIEKKELPLDLKTILDKSSTKFSFLTFINLNMMTYSEKHSLEHHLNHNNTLEIRNITTYIFIFDNSKKQIIHFYKSPKINGDLTYSKHYSMVENQILKFLNNYDK
ncbi:hypothetical protein [Mesonia aquimarina]|uniref:hypothetical protein n=1 Tax=Mesonia aquimarina TaxID=1504967 RepID=UPI0013CE6EB6|nr:hypothetical protein [Mesonia aquimarina]